MLIAVMEVCNSQQYEIVVRDDRESSDALLSILTFVCPTLSTGSALGHDNT